LIYGSTQRSTVVTEVTERLRAVNDDDRRLLFHAFTDDLIHHRRQAVLVRKQQVPEVDELDSIPESATVKEIEGSDVGDELVRWL